MPDIIHVGNLSPDSSLSSALPGFTEKITAAEEASVMGVKKKGAFGHPFPLIFSFVILKQTHILEKVWTLYAVWF